MATEMKAYQTGLSLDRLEIVASSLCDLHCAVVIFLPTLPALLGVGGTMGPRTEWGLTIMAIAFAAAALGTGYFRHQSTMVLISLVAGVSGLLMARFLEGSSGCQGCSAHGADYTATTIGIGGGLTLIMGHFFNLRVSKSCDCCTDSTTDH